MIDSLIECPLCNSPLCYQSIHEGKASWNCLGCGYVTNSNMMNNTELIKAYEMTIPRLYVDIKKVDKSNLVWYPAVLDYTHHGKGIVFANGQTVEDWKWTYAPSILVKEEEKQNFKKKDGSYHTYKTDMKNAKHYKRNEFGLAVANLELV